MKTTMFLIPWMFLASLGAAEPGYTIVARGPHERLWQRTLSHSLPGGKIVPQTQSYTEYCQGMHFWSEGQWRESSETIELLQRNFRGILGLKP